MRHHTLSNRYKQYNAAQLLIDIMSVANAPKEKFDTQKNRLYTKEQVLQIVEATLRMMENTTAPVQEQSHLDNSTSQQSSPSTKMTLSVKEAAELIRISKPKMYALIHKNEIPSIYVGKKILIARQALLDWLSGGDTYGKKAC